MKMSYSMKMKMSVFFYVFSYLFTFRFCRRKHSFLDNLYKIYQYYLYNQCHDILFIFLITKTIFVEFTHTRALGHTLLLRKMLKSLWLHLSSHLRRILSLRILTLRILTLRILRKLCLLRKTLLWILSLRILRKILLWKLTLRISLRWVCPIALLWILLLPSLIQRIRRILIIHYNFLI